LRQANVCQRWFRAFPPWFLAASFLLFSGPSQPLLAQSVADLSSSKPSTDLTRLSKVFGTDSRQAVTDTTSFPWSTIGLVVSTWKERGTWVGTGVMIGRQTVLTCGHNVCDPAEHWADSIVFIPAKNGTSEPFGRISVTRHFAWDAWVQKGDSQYDIAVLILESSVGDQTGRMDFSAQPAAFFKGRLLNSAGYPGDLAVEYGMYSESANAREVDGNFILHTVDATAGQSGSPLWDYNSISQARTIVGVMRGSRTTTNSDGTTEEWNIAVRITDQFEAWIGDLLTQYDEDPSRSSTGTGSTATTLSGRAEPSTGLVPACGAGILGPLALSLAVIPLLARTRRSRRG